MSRCEGTAARGFPCRAAARPGFLTCRHHAPQEALCARLVPERVGCEQMHLPGIIEAHSATERPIVPSPVERYVIAARLGVGARDGGPPTT